MAREELQAQYRADGNRSASRRRAGRLHREAGKQSAIQAQFGRLR
jgi:hypothetical protein